ncbi:hypothetical protein ETU09_08005 [Apibacter muscae]|uniref:Uncharacterized protein n=1 Tax=Apibacter muscae TaxID=2509004 RepID=A0A563DAT4_9FLAO|nr:hypothetical protein [Apibacter muscae]TWP27053.1 hypothetical protein ETU09_08005 [Apibacter muscae]
MQDFSFTISINSEKSEQELFNLILNEIPETVKEAGAHIRLLNNIMKFDKNYDYDPNLFKTEDAIYHYKYFLDIFPVGNVDLENQKKIMKILLDFFKNKNITRGLIAEIEEKELYE